jgi:hypothetical protein
MRNLRLDLPWTVFAINCVFAAVASSAHSPERLVLDSTNPKNPFDTRKAAEQGGPAYGNKRDGGRYLHPEAFGQPREQGMAASKIDPIRQRSRYPGPRQP